MAMFEKNDLILKSLRLSDAEKFAKSNHIKLIGPEDLYDLCAKHGINIENYAGRGGLLKILLNFFRKLHGGFMALYARGQR